MNFSFTVLLEVFKEYGLLIVAVFLIIQFGFSNSKRERIRKFLSEEPDLFPTSPEFSMPEPLMNELPESVEVLRSKLDNGETVHRMMFGFYGNGPAVLVATNKRVFRIYRKNLSATFVQTHVFSINYCEISSIIQQESNILLPWIKIKPINGDDIIIDKISDFKHIDPFLSFVNESIKLSKSSEISNLNTDQLLRIGKDGEDLGEMPIKKVKMLLTSGHLTLTDLYWDYQLNEWIPLSSCDAVA
jgi:hypothetical protein